MALARHAPSVNDERGGGSGAESSSLVLVERAGRQNDGKTPLSPDSHVCDLWIRNVFEAGI